MTFITNRVSIPLPVGKPNQTKTRQGAASLQRILVAVVTCVVGMVLACVIAAAVFHDSSRAHQDLQDRAVLSLDLVSLPLGDAVSRQDKKPRQSPVSGLATNDDFVCATIFGLDEKVVDHASTKLDQRTPTAADLKLLTTAMGETLPPARRLDLRFDRAIAFVQPLYADDGRTIATLFARSQPIGRLPSTCAALSMTRSAAFWCSSPSRSSSTCLSRGSRPPGAVDGSHP